VVVCTGTECVNEGLMICSIMKLMLFDKVPEMPDGQIYCQELPIKSAVMGLQWSEKYEIGHHMPSMSCWRTAPTAMSEVSVTIHVGADGLE